MSKKLFSTDITLQASLIGMDANMDLRYLEANVRC